MKIKIYNKYPEKISFDYLKIVKDIRKAFNEREKLSLILVNNAEIHYMNRQYRNKDYPTDVLSFDGEGDYLGDIFISIDKVVEQASNYKHTVEREFAFLLVHGILHLKGYDHMEFQDEIVMFKKQEEILQKLNYKR